MKKLPILVSGIALIVSAYALWKTSTTTVSPQVLMSVASDNAPAFMEALQAGMMKAEDQKRQDALKNLGSKKEALFGPTDAYMGAKDGTLVVAEFFDYNCGYCIKAAEVVKELIAANPNVKVILKDLPVLGPVSQTLARVALAAGMQGQYRKVHNLLMAPKKPILDSEAAIKAFADKNGLDAAKLMADMNSDAVTAQLKENVELAAALGIQGTPAFVTPSKIYPGLVGKDQLLSDMTSSTAQS